MATVTNLKLDSSLSEIKGVGQVLVKNFDSIGILTIRDLLFYFPRRYDDYSNVVKIVNLRPGLVSIEVIINQISGRYLRRGLHITEALVSDSTGSIKLIWFNQPYRAKSLIKNVSYYVSGKFELRSSRFVIMNPSVELVSDFPFNTARIIPVYRANRNISVRQIRQAIGLVFKANIKIPESLPSNIVKQHTLISLYEALYLVHFPESFSRLNQARYRLGFEEVLALFLASFKNKEFLKKTHSKVINFNEPLAKKFVSSLPFKLTDSQRKVIWQIYLDLEKDLPMNRLIEGDVGSGKTVVALMAALMVINQGWQVVFMAPTEVLARQHAQTINDLLTPLGLSDKVDLLVGSKSLKEKQLTKQNLREGKTALIIGTHALLEPDVLMDKLALVIVDEQHRFGVEQRKALQLKAGSMPHLLSLSATPIPRSLALTLFGELSISRLLEKPAKRLKIKTKIIVEENIKCVYQVMRDEMNKGRQVFVVCPLIVRDNFFKGKSVELIYQQFKKEVFQGYRLGLLHGKMKPKDKNTVMDNFVKHELDLIVTTTVIEVGVDVPNATVMVILDVDQFGLAQIHQLRGRIGRGSEQGYCFLVGDYSITKNPRIRCLEDLDDGFQLAELDLKLRGPGALYGLSQHGTLDLRFASLDDKNLIESAKKAANNFMISSDSLIKYKELNEKVVYLSKISNLN